MRAPASDPLGRYYCSHHLLRGDTLRYAIVSISIASLLAGAACAASDETPTSDLVRRVDSIFAGAVDEGRSASYAVGIEQDGNVVLAKGYGLADVENDVPATAETVYRIGSITKQFTAAAIMQLVEAGTIALDDPLRKYVPGLPLQGHTVTIHHLLTHTSGIPSYTSLGERFWSRSRIDLSHAELIDLIDDDPFDFAPGDQWRYNNSGYYLLGMIIENASGQAYDEYIDDHLVVPLGLTGTSYCHERNIILHRAEGYAKEADTLINDEPLSMNVPGAAGALCSTVNDLLAWRRALFAGDIVSSESLTKMTTPVTLNDDSTTAYAYGLAVGNLEGHREIAHGGGINGFNTFMAYYPDDQLTIVVLSNTEGGGPGPLSREVAGIMLATSHTP